MPPTFRFGLYSALLFSVPAGMLAACGSEEGTGIGAYVPPEGSEDAGDNGSDDDPALGGSPAPNNGGRAPRLEAEEVCETLTAEAEGTPVDLYIMVDQSISMAEVTASGRTRWQEVTTALRSFVTHESAAGVGVGIDFFGIGLDEEENCRAENYSDPTVPIGELPDNEAELEAAIEDAVGPASMSYTPTYAALDGALEYAKQHAESLAAANSTRGTVVVLASDGFPSQCETSLRAITDRVEIGLMEPAVHTFVIALTESEANAEQIATAGGGRAFIIRDQEDVATRFLEALLAVGSTRVGCVYRLPRELPGDEPSAASDAGESDGGTSELREFRGDIAEVGFRSDVTGKTTYLRKVSGKSTCGEEGGFYFDRPKDPTLLALCDNTCADLGVGRLRIELACIEGSGAIQ